MTAKKKAVKKEPVVKTNFYALACDIEEISNRLGQIQELLSVTAENVFDSRSELLWLSADLVGTEIKKLDTTVQKIMDIHSVEKDK